MKLLRHGHVLGGQRARFPIQLAVFGVIGLTAFACGFLVYSAAEAGKLLQSFGYFVMLGTFFWWMCSLLRIAPFPTTKAISVDWRNCFNEHRAAMGLIGGFTVVAWLTVPYSFKVLFDELVLQSTAWNLHFFREFGTMVRGYEVEGVFRSLFVYVDKRPFFYPFIVSLTHDLTGFRLINAYAVNTALLPVCLFLIYRIMGLLVGWREALVGLAFFGASSLLAQNANGSGMEMLNLAMILGTVLLAIHFLAEPNQRRLSALVLSCILLSQTRYESALYVLPAALVILEGWRRAGKVILSPAALTAPLLLIPCALHNTYLAGTPGLWELRENATSRFSIEFVSGNLKHAGSYFFDFSGRLLSSGWLSLIGFPALLTAIILLSRNFKSWKTASGPVVVAALFGAAVAANLGLLMFYYWGQLDDAIVSRLILPFNALLAISISSSLTQLPSRWQSTARSWLIVGALLAYLGFGLTAIAHNRTINQQAWEIDWEDRWVSARPAVPRLIITNKSAIDWLVREIPSIAVARARYVAAQIKYHLQAATFQEVLVSQYYRPIGPDGGFVLEPLDALPSSFVLEPLVERQIGGKLLRISRVVEINIPVVTDADSVAKLKAIRSTFKNPYE